MLLDGWQDEIQRSVKYTSSLSPYLTDIGRHVSPELLRVYKYHGIRKCIDLDSLVKHDIILTTYATLASDFMKGSSPLQQVTWFRVVLDEGMNFTARDSRLFASAETPTS